MTDRNDGSDASSSEDLIRQAREAYDVSTDAPVASSHEDAPASAPAYAADTTGNADTITRPSDYVRSEYQTDAYAPDAAPIGGAVTYEAQKPSFFQRFGGLTIGAIVILGFVLFSMFDRTKNIEDLAVGDCLRMPETGEISSVESADCTEDHELEVFALVTLAESSTAPYPGEDAVATAIFELCLPRFEPYIGTSYSDSIWWINAIFPTQESWEDVDDREGTCVVYQEDLGGDVVTLTGTARGSAS